MLVLIVADAAVEKRKQDRAVLQRFDILILRIHGHRPEDYLEVGIQVQDLLMGIEDSDLAPTAGGRPIHGKFGFRVSRHADTSFSKDEASSFIPSPSSFPHASGPSLRISSTKRVVSLAKRAPSAALAQTSLTRSGSIPIPLRTRRSRRKRRSAL